VTAAVSWRTDWRRPSLAMLWPFLAVALPVLASLLAAMPAVDLAYQLRAGGEILDSGSIPRVDGWTFIVAGTPWADQQWGGQVLLALAYRGAGWTGLAILRAALVGVTVGLLLALVRRRGPRLGPMGATLLVLAAFAVMASSLALRPQLLAIPLFALTLVLIADRDARPTRLWAIPLIAIAWANLHGSFPLVLVLLALALLADLADRRSPRLLGAVTLASAAATLVNPLGLGVWTYVVDLATNPTISSRVSEWRPPVPTDPPGLLFYLSVVAVVALLAVLARRGRRLPGWPGILTLAGFGALAAATGRGLAWWPPVALFAIAPIVAEEIPIARLASSTRPSRLNSSLVSLLLVVGVALLPAWRPLGPDGVPGGTLSHAPEGIAAWLRANVRGNPADPNAPSQRHPRVWAPQAWNSWLEFAVPGNLYGFDSRIELYPPELWSDYDTVQSGRTPALGTLDSHGIDIVVTEAGASHAALDGALEASGRWDRAYEDADGSIWVRVAG
jgi:hypothetical protein